MSRPIVTFDEWLFKAKKIWNDSFDFEIAKSDWIDSRHKIKIKCNKCGLISLKVPSNIISPSKLNGCRNCSINDKRMSLSSFHERTKVLYGNMYDYSLFTEYKNNHQKIKIICKKHGVFEKNISDHLRGQGCNKCSWELLAHNRKLSNEEFINKSKNIFQHKFEYLSSYGNNSKELVILKCNICETIFKTRPYSHLNSPFGNCPKCSNKSGGELKIKEILIKNNIEFVQQYTFESCVNKRKLPFDFYLPKYNICIEYDGQHHFSPIRFGGIKIETAIYLFKKTIRNDYIKTIFCNDNKIKLIRIPYFDKRNIESIILGFLT